MQNICFFLEIKHLSFEKVCLIDVRPLHRKIIILSILEFSTCFSYYTVKEADNLLKKTKNIWSICINF